MKERKMSLVLFYYLSLIFLEVIFRIVCIKSITLTFINSLLYLIPISFLLAFLTTLFKNKKVNEVEKYIKNTNITLLNEKWYNKIIRVLKNIFKRK